MNLYMLARQLECKYQHLFDPYKLNVSIEPKKTMTQVYAFVHLESGPVYTPICWVLNKSESSKFIEDKAKWLIKNLLDEIKLKR